MKFAILIGLIASTVAYADSTGFSVVSGGTPDPTLSQLTDKGPADPNSTIVVNLVMVSKNAAGLLAYSNSVTDPTSPNYQKYLTSAQYCQMFGGDSAAISQAMAYFSSKGIVLTQNTACTNLTGTGTIAQVNGAFQTNMENFLSPAKGTQPAASVLSFTTPLMLPSTFAAAIADVPSLTQVKIAP